MRSFPLLQIPALLLAGLASACSDATEPADPYQIQVLAPSDSVIRGRTLQLSAEVRDTILGTVADRPIYWLSGDPRIATVDSTGWR